jgi:hypothetical protein
VSKNDEYFAQKCRNIQKLFFYFFETYYFMTEMEINGKSLQTHPFGDLRGRGNGAEP